MVKKLIVLLGLSCLFAVLLTGCGGVGSSPNPVHMNTRSFAQSTLTINKGESITLINDNLFVSHTIANGTWTSGSAQPARETGAPAVKNVQIGGNSSVTIGPFISAGTFKLYCTVHVGMNLTVIVR